LHLPLISEEKLDLDRLFARIVTGQAVIALSNKTQVILKDPSIFEKQLADVMYDQEMETLLDDGLYTSEEVMEKMQKYGLWTTEYTTLEKQIPIEIRSVSEEIAKCKFRSISKSALIRRKENLEKKYSEIQRIKNSMLHNSADAIANHIKHKYLIYLLTYNINMKQYFSNVSFEEYLDVYDREVQEILDHGFYPKNIEEKDIRKLARSEPWRSVWLTAQKTGNLFGKPSIEITDLQRALITWSLIYDAAKESTNCPSAEIFDDDDAFDAWLASQSNRDDKNDHGPRILKDTDGTDIGIMAETVEDAQRVYAMNNTTVKKNIVKNNKVIAERGQIEAGMLPDAQQLLRMKAAQIKNPGVG